MRKNAIQTLLFSLLWIFTTINLNGQSQSTVVCGRIINQTNETPKVISINACDPLGDNDKFASRIDSSGLFRATFEMLLGHSFTVSYDKQFINLYANPGDSIYIEIDAMKFHQSINHTISLRGDNSQKNIEFSQAFNDLNKILRLSSNNFSLPLTEFMKSFEADNNRINDSIASYCRERNISAWTQKLMQDMSLYTLANDAMDYKGRNTREALEFFSHPIFDIYNPRKFDNMMFPIHIRTFMYSMLKNDSLYAAYAKVQDIINIEKRGNELLLQLPKSLTRDVLLYSFYKRLKGGSLEINMNNFTNEKIFGKVLALRKSKQLIELPEIKSGKGAFYWTPNGKIENIKSFSLDYLIKEKYKGKVIYMDMWATWCAPCREQMIPAKELHKLFHNKNVVFLNICMKSNQEAWAKIVGNSEIEGENYFFDDDLSSEAATCLLSGGYPTFILIGKDGKIRTKEAPRPLSITQASEAIDKLLAE